MPINWNKLDRLRQNVVDEFTTLLGLYTQRPVELQQAVEWWQKWPSAYQDRHPQDLWRYLVEARREMIHLVQRFPAIRSDCLALNDAMLALMSELRAQWLDARRQQDNDPPLNDAGGEVL